MIGRKKGQNTNTQKLSHIHTRTNIHTNHTYTHTWMHKYTQTHKHTFTNVHTQTHTYTDYMHITLCPYKFTSGFSHK